MAKRFGHKSKPTPRKNSKLAAVDKKAKGGKPKSRIKSRESNPTVEDETDDVMEDEPVSSEPRGRGDAGKLLTDPNRVRSDLQLVSQAVAKGWNVRRKTMIRRRLESIVDKKLGEVVTKDGVIKTESMADKLAIDAAKVLVAMDNQDLTRVKDDREATKGVPEPQPQTVNINVNLDDRRLGLARLAQRFGARELVIDGRAVPLTDIVGAADPVPEE